MNADYSHAARDSDERDARAETPSSGEHGRPVQLRRMLQARTFEEQTQLLTPRSQSTGKAAIQMTAEIPYNTQIDGETGRPTDPEAPTPSTRLPAIADWRGRRILHQLSQIDAEPLTRADANRCGPQAVLAVHIMAGAQAVRRVAEDTHHRLNRLVQRLGDPSLVRPCRAIATEIRVLIDWSRPTYKHLYLLAEGLYLVANENSAAEAAPAPGRPIPENGGAATTPAELGRIADVGHPAVGTQNALRSGPTNFFGGGDIHGRAALTNLPAPGTIMNGQGDAVTLMKQLREYRDVALILGVAVPVGPGGAVTGHAITLGADRTGLVYLYDPSPRSGQQTLYWPSNGAAILMYFPGPFSVAERVAAATEDARRRVR
jgi:hypothetical protein